MDGRESGSPRSQANRIVGAWSSSWFSSTQAPHPIRMSTWKVLNPKLRPAELLIASTPHLVGGGLQSSYT